MKVLVTGADGQLGTDLCKTLKHHEVIPLTIKDGDITDFSFVRNKCLEHKPDVIINTAAYVLVDACEDNKDLAFQVNALGARNVAVAAEKVDAKLLHISTDYVFGGEDKPRTTPYNEFDNPTPCNVYGESKLAGEEFIRHLSRKYFIVRSSSLFGAAGAMGKGGNFVETILKLAKEKPELKVVNDQVFSPTYTWNLADKIAELIKTEYYGLSHITNSGECSWYEFATEILKLTGSKTPVLPITSAQYLQKAKRPKYSVLNNYQLRLLGIEEMPTWQKALKQYILEKGY
jgi:dTDP-4-dehydrorhamnose reductase